MLDEFPDGVWLIELAPITDPDAVMAATASILRAQPQPGVSVLNSIVAWCHRRRILLIIDNCEHVLAPAVELVSAINAGCENVTIVATSREPLRVDGERVIRIPSLEQHHGVELFCARAQAAEDSFVPSPDDRATIATICDRLDGIPLAIELAAARSRSLSPAELLQRSTTDSISLRSSGPGSLERHQTLRATVTWSYQLLSPQHRLLFDRLSVFAGGFALDAAQSVCAGGGVDVDDVIDLVGELVDKSMVTSHRAGSTTRYRVLETLRQYGEECLDERGETAAVATDTWLTTGTSPSASTHGGGAPHNSTPTPSATRNGTTSEPHTDGPSPRELSNKPPTSSTAPAPTIRLVCGSRSPAGRYGRSSWENVNTFLAASFSSVSPTGRCWWVTSSGPNGLLSSDSIRRRREVENAGARV